MSRFTNVTNTLFLTKGRTLSFVPISFPWLLQTGGVASAACARVFPRVANTCHVPRLVAANGDGDVHPAFAFPERRSRGRSHGDPQRRAGLEDGEDRPESPDLRPVPLGGTRSSRAEETQLKWQRDVLTAKSSST